MPSRKSAPIFCTCVTCVRTTGHSNGIQFSSAHARSAHLARAQLERRADSEAARDELDAITAQMFTTLVLDDGPDLAHRPSKLWTSREEFQREWDATHDLPDPPRLPDVNDIIEGFNRLNVGASAPHDIAGADLQGRTQKVRKRETHWRTQQTLSALANMKTRIQRSKEKLLRPSDDALCEVESEIETIHLALSKVTRHTTSIHGEKETVLKLLEGLDSRVAEQRQSIPHSWQKPMVFNSGKTPPCGCQFC